MTCFALIFVIPASMFPFSNASLLRGVVGYVVVHVFASVNMTVGGNSHQSARRRGSVDSVISLQTGARFHFD
jgi:hypothetical protein